VPRIRVHFISRDEKTGADHHGGGLIDVSNLFACPYWMGVPGPTHHEILVHFEFWAPEGQRRQKKWLCYFRAHNPDRQCFSAADEREELKEYVDGNSYVKTVTDTEATEWFKRHGREPPDLSREDVKSQETP
jgi:hypothetical protein